MKISIIVSFVVLCFSIQIMASEGHLKNKMTKANRFAFAKDLTQIEEAIWPYSILSIGHSMQSYQKYGFSGAYWHDGLDIRGNANQPVFATVSGKIVNIENYYPGQPLYWEVAILDDSGFVWKYHHVDSKSIPEEIKKAYKDGTRIKQGDHIGNIVPWPVTAHGEVYNHIHMLIVDGKGRYVNPFRLLPKLADTSIPEILEIGIFDSNLKRLKGNTVRGKHGLYVNAFDTVLHEKFSLTPYLITYRLDNGPERLVWRFDHLPSVDNDKDFINDFYLKGTCGDYSCRNFIINLNFDTSSNNGTTFLVLEPGSHQVDVTVMDFSGNKASKSFIYLVK